MLKRNWTPIYNSMFEKLMLDHPDDWWELLLEDQSYILAEYRPNLPDWDLDIHDDEFLDYLLSIDVFRDKVRHLIE